MQRVQADHINFSTRHAGRVIRYHAWPTLQTQTVAEHTWQLERIFLEVFRMPRAEVFVYIQDHDKTEIGTGDNPYHIKKANPDLKAALDRIEGDVARRMKLDDHELTVYEKFCVKFCDVLEMYEFGVMETMLGNRYAEPIVDATRADLEERAQQLKPEHIESLVDYFTTHSLPDIAFPIPSPEY